jgi:hypothetical protein
MITYNFTTKHDGNIAFHVNDNENKVLANRLALEKKYNINVKNLKYMNQTHGCNIHIVTKDSKKCLDDCDAIITNEVNLPLMVMVADCIPILIYDENKNVIAAVHAGRNSTFLKIVEKTILKMIEIFDCKINNIKVVLGPSIKKCCYEVSEELENIVINSFGKEFSDNRYIDLQKINKKQLVDIGVKASNISISNICTKCSGKDYYSYRLNNKCGRFSGIIEINKE